MDDGSDSDEEKYVGPPLGQEKRDFKKQFMYCFPVLHEFLSIFSVYDEDAPMVVRFTVYYFKMVIMMALTSIFG